MVRWAKDDYLIEGVITLPIDATYTVKPKALKKFRPIPSDKYQVQITDINLVNQLNSFSGKEEERLNFEFTVLDSKDFEYVDEEGEKQIEPVRGRKLWKRVSPSNSAGGKKSKASWLYKILCAVEKREIPEGELAEVSPATLVGQQLLVMVEVSGEYNNILSFGPSAKDLEPVPALEAVEDLTLPSEETEEGKKKLL